MNCPLCENSDSTQYHADHVRSYMQCKVCGLIFVPKQYHLSAIEEKARYDLHQNIPEDAGYRAFLGKLLNPMIDILAEGSQGLDFGCGPGPTLSLLFKETGFHCVDYDPFYAPNQELLQRHYDFVSCSEVIEHCYYPNQTFDQLFSLLKPGGILGVMTQWARDQSAFVQWRYIDDDTHVCFYSPPTFYWVAQRYGVRVEFVANSVALFFV